LFYVGLRNSKNAPFVSLALLSLPLGFLLLNWDLVKKRVGKQGADVVQESIKSERLQSTAVTVSKLLLQELLQDEDVHVFVLNSRTIMFSFIS
jgi:hypothetical protein